MPSPLYAPLFTPDSDIWSDQALVAAMLAFEAALAEAEAACGVVPEAAASTIRRIADRGLAGGADLAEGAAIAGNLAIPLVKTLTAKVKALDPEAAKWVHFGATSQDVLDTALVLVLKASFEHIERGLATLAATLADRVERWRETPMAARTWLQQALPTTFGLKLAGVLDALNRHRDRFAESRPRILALQFGGAAGTLASLGDKGPHVAAALAARLGLASPDAPWHGARDRIVEAAALYAGLAMTLAKFARDAALLMQTEVGEVVEPSVPGRGGSSTMPHKVNPMLSATILGAAAQLPGLMATIVAVGAGEHERAAGAWQAEWIALPDLARLAHGVLARATELAAGLEARPERMADNLGLTGGLLMAEAVQMRLAPRLGRLVAHDLIEAACRRAARGGRSLADELADDPAIAAHATRDDLEDWLRPQTYLGAAQTFIDQVLAAHRARQER